MVMTVNEARWAVVEANLGCRVQAKALAITCQSYLEGMQGLSEKRSSLESLYNARNYAEIRKGFQKGNVMAPDERSYGKRRMECPRRVLLLRT